MLIPSAGTKVFVYTPSSDMRKGIDGLSGIVRNEFAADPTDGSLYLFIHRPRDRMKILHFDGGGSWLFADPGCITACSKRAQPSR